MKPKKGDSVFIDKCALIDRDDIVADIECVRKINNKVFAKLLGSLWFDITYFEYDNKYGFWREILPNDKTKALVKL